MKKILPFAIASVFFILGCTPEPIDPTVTTTTTAPIRLDSSFLSPVKEIKYYSNGSYFYEFADTGIYTFSADTIGNQFKINIDLIKKNRGTSITKSVKFVYRYDTLYRLVQIERNDMSSGNKPVIKLFYNGERLIRFEEWALNTLYKTYNVSHQTVVDGRELYIAPYTSIEDLSPYPGFQIDTFSQQVSFDIQNRVIGFKERIRHLGNCELTMY